MRISTYVVSDFFTNCYILQDEGTGRTAVIDPGEFNDTMREQIDRIGVEYIDYILLTHCHLDHIMGAAALQEYTGAPLAVHISDEAGLSDPEINCASFFGTGSGKAPKADILLRDGDTLALGDLKIKVLHTPGHTAGSVCYVVENTIFSGDTLFLESCGRIDLPTGSSTEILRSLTRLAQLDGDYTVYSGHGDPTTLEYERKHNRYINIDK